MGIAFVRPYLVALLLVSPSCVDTSDGDPVVTTTAKEKQRRTEITGVSDGDRLQAFRKLAESVDPEQAVFKKASVSGYKLTVVIDDAWYSLPDFQKERLAQNTWNMWVQASSPLNPDDARIKMVDTYGKVLAKSGILGGSVINVKR